MEFMLSRASVRINEKPCDEAYIKNYMMKDVKMFKSFEEYDSRGKDNFLDNGSNHRINEEGYIEREFENKTWFVKIDSLEDLLALENKYGEIIIRHSWENRDYMMIFINDAFKAY